MSAVLDILINTDADKATAELKALESQSNKTATATGGLEKATKAANDSYKGLGGGIRNASYQVTDFMVQVQGGTSVIRALSQQLPQLLSGFGMIGVVVGLATTAIGFAIESLDLFPSAMDRVNKATKATETALATLKDMHFKLGDDSVKILQSWQDQWKVSSEAVRKDLKLNLDMYVLTMQAELMALKAREDYDKAIAKGTGRETFTGMLLAEPEKDLNKRAEAMGRLSKATNLQTQLEAFLKVQQNPNAAIPSTSSEIKSQESLIQTYDRKVAAINAEASALQISNVEKKLAVELANLEVDKAKLGTEAYLRLKNAITEAVYARNTKEEEKKLKEYSATQAEHNKIIELEVQQTTMSTRAYEQLVSQKRLNIQLEKDTIGMSASGKDAYITNAQAIFDYQQALKNANYEQQRTFGSGALSAMQRYAETASNVGNDVANAFTNAFKGIEDAFSSFMISGQLNFSNFANAIIGDINRIIVRQAIIAPLTGAIQSAFTSSAPISSGAATVTDYSTPWTGTPMATGTNYVPYDGFPATLHKGEAVVPAEYNPALGGGSGSNVQVNVYNESGGQVETKESQSGNGMKMIDVYIKKAVAEGISNGQFDKAMGSTYGLRRQGQR
jgi:lambda family phage tail tape measure protein